MNSPARQLKPTHPASPHRPFEYQSEHPFPTASSNKPSRPDRRTRRLHILLYRTTPLLARDTCAKREVIATSSPRSTNRRIPEWSRAGVRNTTPPLPTPRTDIKPPSHPPEPATDAYPECYGGAQRDGHADGVASSHLFPSHVSQVRVRMRRDHGGSCSRCRGGGIYAWGIGKRTN